MNFKRFLAGVALVATSALSLQAAAVAKATSQNTFVGRAFSTDMARELMAEQAAWTMNADSDSWYGTMQVIGQYNRNFKSSSATGIGAMPFWSGTNVMTVGNNAHGSVAAGAPYQLDSYQFGLGAQATPGLVLLNPVLYSAGADFLFYVGAHQTEAGFFGKVNFAVGVASVNPQLDEPTANTGVAYAASYMNVATVSAATSVIYPTMTAAFKGGAVPGATSAFQGLNFGQIDGKQTSSAKFGDIDVAVGYNFLANDRSHLGVAVRFTGPTGNKPAGVYVLEPVWGNGGHWGLGGEVFGHATLWQGHDDRCLELWGDIQVQHLFKAAQVRSFDLTNNGAGSKYLLVADFGTAGTTYTGGAVQQLVNLSTLPTNSTVGAVVDMALMLQYNCNNWQFDLGYNFAGKTVEKLAITGTLASLQYVVLGHQDLTTAASTASNKVDANFNMSKAANFAHAGGTTALGNATTNITGNTALNVSGAAQAAGWSSKVFGQVAYRWNDSDYVPTLAVQGSGEFSTSGNNALNQWSVGVRGGFSF